MFKKTALCAGLGLALSATAQADFRFEVAPSITGGDLESLTLSGTAYLQPVDDSKGPLNEAAFIDHSSSLSVILSDGELDSDEGSDIELERYGVSARYVTSQRGSWIVDLAYDREEVDNFEIDNWSIGVGKYLWDTTTLVFTYTFIDPDEGSSVDSFRLDFDHLWLFSSGGGFKLHAAYAFVDTDDDSGLSDDDIDVYEIDGTWYLRRDFGLSAGYRNTDFNTAELEEWFIGAEYFITDKVSVAIAYTDGEIDDTDIDTNSFLFTARARF